MKAKIQIMTERADGIIDLSEDIAPDMFDGEGVNVEDAIAYLRDEAGYTRADGFAGWGDVLRGEDGDLLRVTGTEWATE